MYQDDATRGFIGLIIMKTQGFKTIAHKYSS